MKKKKKCPQGTENVKEPFNEMLDNIMRYDTSKMKWRDRKHTLPNIGEFVVAIRTSHPKSFDVGRFEGFQEETGEDDMFDYWLPLPEPPK